VVEHEPWRVAGDYLEASDGPLAFEFSGRCAYTSTFDYHGPGRDLPASA